MTLPSQPPLLSYEIPELLYPLFWQIPCHFPRRLLLEQVFLFRVECGFVYVPLHSIYLSSDLVNGPVAVGIRQTLPFKGVHLLLGNDLAGDKVVVRVGRKLLRN